METKNRKLKIKVEGQPQCNIKAMRQSNEGTSQDSNPELILMGFQGVNLAKPTIASFLTPLAVLLLECTRAAEDGLCRNPPDRRGRGYNCPGML